MFDKLKSILIKYATSPPPSIRILIVENKICLSFIEKVKFNPNRIIANITFISENNSKINSKEDGKLLNKLKCTINKDTITDSNGGKKR